MSGREHIFQQAMNQGHSAAWDQSWERASGFYRQALEEFPDRPAALTSLGLALFELGDYDESLRCYMKAARLTPDDPVPVEKIAQLYEQIGIPERARAASLQAGELYFKNRDVTKAIENWTHVTHLQPENLAAHSRLAQVYERLGKPDEAVSEYLALAAIFQRANDMEKARRTVQHALQVNPASGLASNAMSLLKENKPLPLPGKPGAPTPKRQPRARQLEASENAQFAQQLNPVDEARQRALSILAALLFESPEEAGGSRAGFQTIMQGAGKPRRGVDSARITLFLGQVVEQQTQGNLAQAGIELSRAMEAGLEHPAASFDLGYLQYQTEDLENATRNLQVAAQSAEYALAAHLLLGQIFSKRERYNQAAVEYLQALSQADAGSVSADQADVLQQLYEPLFEAQSLESDLQIHQQVCENISSLLMQPGWREHIRQARQQLPQQVDGGPPIPLAEILTQSRSSHVVESLSTIYQLDRAGYIRSAMEEAFYALEYAPTYLPLHVMMGELLLKQERVEEAIGKFMAVAQSYRSRGEARRAISLYRRVLEHAPLALEPRMRLIELLTSTNQTEEALNEYIEFAEVYYNQADLENARKTYAQALTLARQSRLDPAWQVRILHRMADIYEQSLDWKEAMLAFEQIRTLHPEDEKSRLQLIELSFRMGQEGRGLGELDNYLGYLEKKGETKKPLVFLEKVAQEHPQRISLMRRLAERYYKAGRVKEAISLLDSAGEKLIEMGDVNSAIQVIEMILALRPPNASDYQSLLAQLRGGR